MRENRDALFLTPSESTQKKRKRKKKAALVLAYPYFSSPLSGAGAGEKKEEGGEKEKVEKWEVTWCFLWVTLTSMESRLV